jgi:ADP-ribose pyrophosphatase YjhB (NUDIX family)
MNQSHNPGRYRFCPLCAVVLELRPESGRERLTCPACGFIYYHNPVPAAGGVICRDRQICLVKRAITPRKGDWTLPAGFMEYEETAAVCAKREVAEETSLEVDTRELLGVYMGFDDPRQHAVLILYWMTERRRNEPVAGDDAAEVGFFSPEDMPENIAFRAHRDALEDIFADPNFTGTPSIGVADA